MTVWAESKVQPGLFTGSTGVKPLSVAELSGGYKAWPKKVDNFTFSRMLDRLIKIPRVSVRRIMLRRSHLHPFFR